MSLQLQRPTRPIHSPTAQVILAPQTVAPQTVAPQILVTESITQTTKSITTQQQSLQLAMVFLHCSISELCYARRIFPSECFEARSVSDDGETLTYEDYVKPPDTEALTLIPDSQDISGPKLLRRGVKSGANTLLDWMEESAFPILSRQRLHSIIFRILGNPQNSQNILEEHVVNIGYPCSADDEALDTAMTNSYIQDAVARLVQYGTGLPTLPRVKYIEMVLQHDLPQQELPKGFRNIDANPIALPNVPGFDIVRHSHILINTGYQDISMNSTCLQPPYSDGLIRSASIPQNPEYMLIKRRVSKLEDDIERKRISCPYPSPQRRLDELLKSDFARMMRPLSEGSQTTSLLGSSPASLYPRSSLNSHITADQLPSPISGPMAHMTLDGHHSQVSNTSRESVNRPKLRATQPSSLAQPSKVYPQVRVAPLSRPSVIGPIRPRPRNERGTIEQARNRLDMLQNILR